MEEAKKGLVQSVSRAAAILRCFDGRGELGLTEISRMVGLHKSTTAGLVNTLRAERLLEQNPATGKLRLGIELFRLSANVRLELGELCAPYLDELLRATGETVSLAMQDGCSVVYVKKQESPHSMRICTNVGQRMPMHCTAAGKAILAFLAPEEVRRILSGGPLLQYTSNTITDPELLLERLRRVREAGYACDLEESEYGLVCVAAPVFGPAGKPVGALGVSGPSIRMTEQIRQDTAKALLAVAASVRRDLAGLGG